MKTVYQCTLDGEIVNVWKSAKDAAQILGYDRAHICDCCNGKRQTSMGYLWIYSPIS